VAAEAVEKVDSHQVILVVQVDQVVVAAKDLQLQVDQELQDKVIMVVILHLHRIITHQVVVALELLEEMLEQLVV
jgi:hypothetical protein